MSTNRLLRQIRELPQRGIGGWLSASAVATDKSVRMMEIASDAIGERNRFTAGSLSAHRPAHPEAPDGTFGTLNYQLLCGS